MKLNYLPIIFSAIFITACATDGTGPGQSTASSAQAKKGTDASKDSSKDSGGVSGMLSSVGSATNKAGVTTSNGTDVGLATMATGDALKAATITDKDIQASAQRSVQYMDKANHATSSGKYGSRLRTLTTKYTRYDGLKLNFKVYVVKEPNAMAFPDGSIRVTSALMDMATDEELRWVLGHEMGHVKLGHSAAKMKAALMTAAVRKGIAASNSMAGAIAASELGGFTEALVNAQYSQSAEREADDYGLAFVKKQKYDPKAAVSILEKFAKLGDKAGVLSSHPSSGDRAQRMRSQLASN